MSKRVLLAASAFMIVAAIPLRGKPVPVVPDREKLIAIALNSILESRPRISAEELRPVLLTYTHELDPLDNRTNGHIRVEFDLPDEERIGVKSVAGKRIFVLMQTNGLVQEGGVSKPRGYSRHRSGIGSEDPVKEAYAWKHRNLPKPTVDSSDRLSGLGMRGTNGAIDIALQAITEQRPDVDVLSLEMRRVYYMCRISRDGRKYADTFFVTFWDSSSVKRTEIGEQVAIVCTEIIVFMDANGTARDVILREREIITPPR